MLQSKIDKAIETLQKYEKLALKYSQAVFMWLSGGKDSQVIYELCQMAGVKFNAYFYKTSVDPMEVLRFIRSNYPDVTWLYPEKTMFQLILKRRCYPSGIVDTVVK